MDTKWIVVGVVVLAIVGAGYILLAQQNNAPLGKPELAIQETCYDCGPAGWQATGKSCSNLVEVDDKTTAATCLNLGFGSDLKESDISEGYIDVGDYAITPGSTNGSSIQVYGNDRWAITRTAKFYMVGLLG